MNFVHQGTDSTVLLSKDTKCGHTKDIHTYISAYTHFTGVCVFVCVYVSVHEHVKLV